MNLKRRKKETEGGIAAVAKYLVASIKYRPELIENLDQGRQVVGVATHHMNEAIQARLQRAIVEPASVHLPEAEL